MSGEKMKVNDVYRLFSQK